MVGKAGITVMVVVTIATAAIVTVVGDITTRTVTVILMAVMAAIVVTVIGEGALLVVTRPIIAGARVTPEALPGPVVQLARQGTSMPPMIAPAGKFAFHYVFVALRGLPWYPGEHCGGTRLKCCKLEKYQCPSPITVSSPSLLSFHSVLQ
jgi:hypothetical protein